MKAYKRIDVTTLKTTNCQEQSAESLSIHKSFTLRFTRKRITAKSFEEDPNSNLIAT